MKSGQVKELVARWRSPEYDKPYRGPAFCADELEQAERVAVGQGGAELPSCEMCDAEITNNTVVCTNCWNRVAPLAAPRPEASTREALQAFADKLEAAIKARDFRNEWTPWGVQQSCSEMVHEKLDEFSDTIAEQKKPGTELQSLTNEGLDGPLNLYMIGRISRTEFLKQINAAIGTTAQPEQEKQK